ncbi:expressed unknown protein [Seminavis robusta]|uniref:Uncharacterized protein n=1 Tax=Seminavis robusta TaxID=568900 RepID=A0A9N8DT58_9STRA|nr:expressed unknown protein [Seminavis robusta]|eukprot:Sro352_g124330.1 n/a (324) ;mRNA; f:62012-63203
MGSWTSFFRWILLAAWMATSVHTQTLQPLQTVAPQFQTTTPVTAATTNPAFATTNPVTTATANPQTAATVATIPPTTLAPNADWTGCVDPDSPDEPIRIGKKTTICIILGSNTNWNAGVPPVRYLRLSFQPLADEYSRFHVPSSYQDLVTTQATQVYNGNNNVTIHVASQKVLSFQRIFYDPNQGSGRVYPHLTAIIDVRKGIVDGITWDDGCLFCGNDKCLENTYDFNGNEGNQETFGQPTKGCFITQPECAAFLLNQEPRCDVTVYVVWTGDDADGRALQSSAFRFSSFPEQELANRIQDSLPELPFGLTGGSTSDAGGAA